MGGHKKAARPQGAQPLTAGLGKGSALALRSHRPAACLFLSGTPLRAETAPQSVSTQQEKVMVLGP